MKHKQTILAMSLLFSVLLLPACRSVTSILDYGMLSSKAEERLESMVKRLLTPPGAVLVKRVNASMGGQIPECQGNMIQAFYGTDDLSFQQVMSFYATSLQAQGWHLDAADNHGQTFSIGDEFTADVSDLVDVSFIGRDVIQEGKREYRTVYLLGLYTSILVPAPPQCKGG